MKEILPNVVRFCFDSFPLTRRTISFSSELQISRYFPKPVGRACVISFVQYKQAIAKIVCPGQSKTHSFLNLVEYASLARFTLFKDEIVSKVMLE